MTTALCYGMSCLQIFSVNVTAGALLVKEAYPYLLKSKLVCTVSL